MYPTHRLLATLVLGTALALSAARVAAQQANESVANAGVANASVLIALLGNPQVIGAHPDLFYRDLGVQAYQAGDKTRAVKLLQKAAGYADKPAQAMLAAMYWNGDGIPRDRPRGYAWMDLAADRGYRDLLIQREHYWGQLSAAERKQAISTGRRVYAGYNNERGLRKLDLALKQAADRATGSRTGFGGSNLTVRLRGGAAGPALAPKGGTGPTELGGTPVRGTDYYATQLWSAAPYAKLKDQVWEYARHETGKVEIGPLQALPAPAASSDGK